MFAGRLDLLQDLNGTYDIKQNLSSAGRPAKTSRPRISWCIGMTPASVSAMIRLAGWTTSLAAVRASNISTSHHAS